MRLLLDENTGRRARRDRLQRTGHDVERVVDIGLRGQQDAAVLQYAVRENRVIITRDKAHDEGEDLVTQWTKVEGDKPSLVLIFPGDVITVAEIVHALERIADCGVERNQICPVNVWGRV